MRIRIGPAAQLHVTVDWLARLGLKPGDEVEAERDPRQDERDPRTDRPTPRARSFMGAVRFPSPKTGEMVTLLRDEFVTVS